MIPKILHQTGVAVPARTAGDAVPAWRLARWEERRLAGKAQTIMPDWEYRLWTDDDNDSLVEEIIPEHIREFRMLPAPVIRADIARCLFLYKFGGIYFDTDYKFFQAPGTEFLGQKCVLGIEDYANRAHRVDAKLGNAFMASEPGFGLWLDFVRKIFEDVANRPGEKVVMLSGPHALTRFLNKNLGYKAQIRILPPETIYPDFARMKLTGVRQANTIGVHLCWGGWRNKGLVQRGRNQARRILSAL